MCIYYDSQPYPSQFLVLCIDEEEEENEELGDAEDEERNEELDDILAGMQG